jgi:hypothetical protein
MENWVWCAVRGAYLATGSGGADPWWCPSSSNQNPSVHEHRLCTMDKRLWYGAGEKGCPEG